MSFDETELRALCAHEDIAIAQTAHHAVTARTEAATPNGMASTLFSAAVTHYENKLRELIAARERSQA